MRKITKLFIGIIIISVLFAVGIKGNVASAKEPSFVKIINVKDYGAKDGQDSTNAIQKALDAAGNAGTASAQAKVVIPKGTYYISSRLLIGSNTYLQLEKGAVIKKSDKAADKTFYMLHTKTGKKGKYADNVNITVDGGTWDAEFKTSNKESGGSVFAITHCTNLVIKDSTICNNYGTHLIELDGVKDCTISGCTLFGFKSASKDTEKEAIQLDVCHDDVIAPGAAPYDDTPCLNVTIKNNEIYNYPRAFGSHTMVDKIYHKNIKVIDNNIHDIDAAAVYGYNYVNVTISGNKMNNVGCGIQLKSYSEKAKTSVLSRLKGVKAMKLKNNIYNITISKNDIVTKSISAKEVGNDGGPMAIFIYGTKTYPVNKLTISDNTLVTDSSGVYLKYTNNASIKNNYIDRHDKAYDVEKTVFAEDAIKLLNTQKTSIVGNRISTKSATSYENGIALRDDSKSITSSENELHNTTKSGIAVYSGCEYSGKNEILNNAGKHGITVDGGKASVENFTVNKCGENGITLKNKATLKAKDCTIEENVGKGILAVGKSVIEIDNVKINNSGENGISLTDSSLNAKDSAISGSKEKGIGVMGGSEAILTGTVITNSGDTGVLVAASTLKASDCTVQGNKGKGVLAMNEATVELTDSLVCESGDTGVSLSKSNAVLLNTNVENNGDTGILVGASTLKATNCTVKGNKGKGVLAMNEATVELIDSLVCESGDNGVYSSKSKTVLLNSTVENNEDTGVSANESEFSVTDSKISGNKGKGITVSKESDFTLSRSEIKGNASTGLKVESSKINAENNSFTGNCATEEEGKAVFMMAGASGKFVKNSLYNETVKHELFVSEDAKFTPVITTQKAEKIRGLADDAGNTYSEK